MGDQVTNKPRPTSAGARFRDAVLAEKPLQIVGASNAYLARMAERVGFKALYLSGGALSAGSLGLQLHVQRAGTEREIAAAFAELIRLRAGGLVVGTDPFFTTQSRQLCVPKTSSGDDLGFGLSAPGDCGW